MAFDETELISGKNSFAHMLGAPCTDSAGKIFLLDISTTLDHHFDNLSTNSEYSAT